MYNYDVCVCLCVCVPQAVWLSIKKGVVAWFGNQIAMIISYFYTYGISAKIIFIKVRGIEASAPGDNRDLLTNDICYVMDSQSCNLTFQSELR